MALRGFQRASARNAAEQMRRANQRRWQLLNPPAQELPQQAMSGISSLVSSYNQAYGEAKAANEARYQQLLDIANQTTQQRQADVTSAYNQQSADAMQNLARLGLSNTTIAPTLQMGVEREKQASLDRLADTMQQTKLGIIERRTDAYPDPNAVTGAVGSLAQGYNPSSIFSSLARMKM